MSSTFKTSTAISALLAATAISAAGIPWSAHAQDAENGVHAVPSGHVDAGSLPAPRAHGVAGIARAAAAKVRSVVKPQARLAKPAPVAAPARLSVELAQTSPVATPAVADAQVPIAAPALAVATLHTAAAPPAIFLASADAALPSDDSDLALADGSMPSEEGAIYGAARATPAVMTTAGQGADGLLQLARNQRPVRRAPPAPEPEAQPAPAAADDGVHQHVSFPMRSAEAAAAFHGYMRTAASISADFKSGSGVASALRAASSYDPHQLQEGMIAYGAIAALQDASFVYAVMDAAQDPARRAQLAEAILADPSAVTRLRGADSAAALADAAILADARPVVDSGHALKQASYDVQHQSWSTARTPDGPARLAQAKAASAARIAARDGEVGRLLKDVSSMPSAGRSGGSPFTPVAVRSVALAAVSILADPGQQDPASLQTLLTEASSAQCLKMSKLNLFQCLSVAGPEYEDVYCLGQHAVLDTGQCVAAAASPAHQMYEAALPAADANRVMIPIAMNSAAPALK